MASRDNTDGGRGTRGAAHDDVDLAVQRRRHHHHPGPAPRRFGRTPADVPPRLRQPSSGRRCARPRRRSGTVPRPARARLLLTPRAARPRPAARPRRSGHHVLVTLDLPALLTGVGFATTGSGDVITAADARRLACTADLVPAVLGARSEILDLGRAQRLYSPAQRRALAHRDGRCRADGCDIPAAWTEAHHLDSWAGGGRTDLDNALLLCSHHHRAHDDRYGRLPCAPASRAARHRVTA